jgi:hypothetical protein
MHVCNLGARLCKPTFSTTRVRGRSQAALPQLIEVAVGIDAEIAKRIPPAEAPLPWESSPPPRSKPDWWRKPLKLRQELTLGIAKLARIIAEFRENEFRPQKTFTMGKFAALG